MNRRRFLAATTATVLGSAAASLPVLGKQELATPPRIRAIALDALVVFDLAIVDQRAEGVFPGDGTSLTNLWQVTEDALSYAVCKHETAGVIARELNTLPEVCFCFAFAENDLTG